MWEDFQITGAKRSACRQDERRSAMSFELFYIGKRFITKSLSEMSKKVKQLCATQAQMSCLRERPNPR
jgi:hypothetical protein